VINSYKDSIGLGVGKNMNGCVCLVKIVNQVPFLTVYLYVLLILIR